MKKNLSIAISMLLFLLGSASVYAVDWSEDLGRMNWKDANAKCSSLKMRLPSIEELKAAYKSGETKSWKGSDRKGLTYWSSTPVGDDRAYIMLAHNGSSNNYNRNGDSAVRCVR